MSRPRTSKLPFGRATKIIGAKTIALYTERISGGDFASLLAEVFAIDIPPEGTMEKLLLMTVIQPATIMYKAGAISVGSVTDNFGKELFTISHGDKLLGYFEPLVVN